ncbi:hypothetical protein BD413DRAFT_611234 [Trametes elegans]|nr:hypothetical protein BD413DRAFT_611234 [Trametes elegans]
MSFVPGTSRMPAPRNIQGTKPGLLDPSQAQRLLRVPGSTLSFAAFDPLAASGSGSSAHKHYDSDPARPKRIVVEHAPGGRAQNRWRFVPRARRAPGVEDEGVWPRRVLICGEPYICSEDQWDIYKLDPAYDCFIPQFPGDPVITLKEPQPTQSSPRRARGSAEAKKRRSLSPLERDGEQSGMNKRFRKVVNLVTDEEDSDIQSDTESDDEDEVEEIVVEEANGTSYARASGRTRDPRKTQEARRREQREKLKANMTYSSTSSFDSRRSRTPEIVDLTMEDDSPPAEASTNGAPPPGTTKRKLFTESGKKEDTSFTHDGMRPNKRARQLSPDAVAAELARKRTERERRKLAELLARASGIKAHRERKLWEEILADTPIGSPRGSQGSDAGTVPDSQPHMNAAPDAPPMDDEEAQRQAFIEESRRKLAELEKDRPMWEAEARKRAAEERAEEEARRKRKEEERRRAAAAAAQEQRERERAAAEAERRARAEQERLAREHEQRRRRERERWSYGPWTAMRAIERYKQLSEAFDAAKFTPENPAMFETIPWPVLHSPVTLRIEDIDWAAVEDFFASARVHMRAQDYKVFVEKSHKRFHPDRWRARGVLKSVADEETRGCLEVAANTVAQALTPIWREVRG